MLIDTNIIIRYLVEDTTTIDKKFAGVFPFFNRVETAEVTVDCPDLVLFEAFFVLTSYYKVPPAQAAASLLELTSFRGLRLRDKETIRKCLRILTKQNIDLVDAYLLAYAKKRGDVGIYSFDADLKKLGLELISVC